MKKEKRYGTIHITSEKDFPFINASMAMMAMQMLQNLLALQGYLVTSSINLASHRIQLTIHLDNQGMPVIPNGYKYTWKDLSSHEYLSTASNQQERCRCIDYYFEYQHK